MKILKGIIALLPLVITAAVMPFMPEKVPMHYSIDGSVDRMGSRYELLLMPLLIILILAVTSFVVKHYQKRAGGPDDDRNAKTARANIKSLNVISIAVPVIFGALQLGILYMTYQNAKADIVEIKSDLIVRLTFILIGIMCVVFGNLTQRTEMNNLFGVRMKWSMYNENTWRRCNSFGGIVFIIAGLLIIVTSAIVPANVIAVAITAYLLIATVIIMVYSRKVYQEEISGQS